MGRADNQQTTTMSTQQNPPQNDPDSNVSTNEQPPKQTTDPDETVLRYASYYERARVEDTEQGVARELLFQQLEGYQRFLDQEPKVGSQKETWTRLQRLIHNASIYAETYRDHLPRDEIVDTVIRDMNESGWHLSYGIAEWIVREVFEPNQAASDGGET
jgi:hypothetical protein